MNWYLLLVAFLLASSPSPQRTMRIDYYHTGNAGGEVFALDAVALEGPWPGYPDRAIDTTNLGKYLFEVVDLATNRPLYSRGFASIYGEWETTPEAKERHRTFHESVRFPAPERAFQLVVKKRGRWNEFREVWSARVDPADPLTVDRTPPSPSVRVWDVIRSGDPREKVDILLLGDGYTAAEMPKWHDDARRIAGMLFAVEPFRARRSDFNVLAIDTPAGESGVARPSEDVHRRSSLRAAYDAFGSERYILSFDNKRVREIAAAAPYEFLAIVVNERKYGGGGIHNLYATTAADNAWTPYIFVHEFGHHLGGLADEYYSSAVAYESSSGRPEPWEPNVTADPSAARWKDLLAGDAPLPTPWPKAGFEALQQEIQGRRRELRASLRPESEMEALFREEQQRSTQLFRAAPHAGKIGAFEGAMYEASGYYRPQQDCIMFSRNEVGFCAVCRRGIEKVIELYTGAR